MKTIGRVLLSLACIGLMILAVNLLTNNSAEATNPLSVTVTNTPLPVQGSVSVGNTPSVTIANTPSVNVANTAVPIRGDVTVFNPLDAANNPVPLVVNTTGQPYTGQCSGSGNPTSTCVMNTLPSGMRLVIQAVSFSSRSASGANVYRAVIGTTVNGSGPRNLYLALFNTGTDQYGQLYQAATQSATLYSDASSAPACTAIGSGYQ